MKAFLIGFLLLACSAVLHADDDQVTPKEFSVYAAALPDWKESKRKIRLVVFQDHTGTDFFTVGKEDRSGLLKFVQDELGIDDALIQEFARINDKSSTFPKNFRKAFSTETTVLNVKQHNVIFKDGIEQGWKKFYRIYPHSSGIITVSRVAFNAAGDTALVYIGFESAPLGGGGFYYLLHRKNHRWRKIKETFTWMA